jgi:hypothetical protein
MGLGPVWTKGRGQAKKKFIDETKDNKEKQKLLARYLDIVAQIDKLGHKEFEENDVKGYN